MNRTTLWLAAACVFSACATTSNGDAPVSDTRSQTAPKPAQKDAQRSYMQAHFRYAVDLKEAVIAGDLGATREPARWLASQSRHSRSSKSSWSYLDGIRTKMSASLVADNVAQVAELLGEASALCGGCHQAAGASPRIGSPPEPMSDDNEMLIHAWAADQMWEGLVVPDVARWNRGAAAMKDWPLAAFSEHPKGSELSPLAIELKQIASRGFSATEQTTRAEILGQMLRTCGSCHQGTGADAGHRSTP